MVLKGHLFGFYVPAEGGLNSKVSLGGCKLGCLACLG